MKLGIAKIEYIDSRSMRDYGAVAPGASIDTGDFILPGESFTELPFTFNTADLEEGWPASKAGKVSEVTFSAAIRAEREKYRPVLQALAGRKCIFRITRVSGERYVVGSRQAVPTFSYTEKLSGISSSEFAISITNSSKHGILFDVRA